MTCLPVYDCYTRDVLVCSASVYTVRYELTRNGTIVSARDEQSLSITQISSVMHNIFNPQGMPYLTLQTSNMQLVNVESCTSMALSRVVQLTHRSSVQATIKSTIFTSLAAGKGNFDTLLIWCLFVIYQWCM